MSKSVSKAPRLAATILLLRSGAPVTFLMMKRHSKARFMANTYVFPGGGVDDADATVAPSLSLGAFRIAALRELAEEAGLTLTPSGGLTQVTNVNVKIDATSAATLTPFAHWITPEAEKYRYDTWFFSAVVPSGSEKVPLTADPKEVADLCWITPKEAFERHHNVTSSFALPPPTYLIMHYLSQFRTSEDVHKDLLAKGYNDPQRVPCVLAVLELTDEGFPKYMRLRSGSTHLPDGRYTFPVRVGDALLEMTAVVGAGEPVLGQISKL